MKILYVACGSGCDQTMGGSLSRTVEIAKRLSRQHQVSILTTSGGKSAIANQIESQSIIEFKTPLCHLHNEKYFFLKQCISYIRLIINTIPLVLRLPPFDLVYLDSDGLWDVLPALCYKLKYKNIKIVSMNHHKITLRRDDLRSFLFSSINIVLQRIAFILLKRSADAIFVLDTQMGDILREQYREMGYKKYITSVKDGVDTKLIASVNDQVKEYEACFFGYLRPSKGLYDILPIWLNVMKSLPQARLILIGGMLAEYRNYLLNEIKKNNLQKNIIIQDYLPDKEKAIALVKKSHVFISPSHEEGWGISLMECLSSGVPGIVWDLPTYARIFNEGIIKVKQFDIDIFAQEIIRLLTDKKVYSKLKEETIDSVKKFDWDIIAHEEIAIFQQITKK